MSDEKPRLRLVRPNEKRTSTAAPPRDAVLPERLEFERRASAMDVDQAAGARRLAAAGAQLAAGALDLRRLATVAAPPGMFFRGVTPGEKSAEAVRVLLTVHVLEAANGNARPGSLRAAVTAAADEVDKARTVAAKAGVRGDEYAATVFRSVTTQLGELAETASPEPAPPAAPRTTLTPSMFNALVLRHTDATGSGLEVFGVGEEPSSNGVRFWGAFAAGAVTVLLFF